MPDWQIIHGIDKDITLIEISGISFGAPGLLLSKLSFITRSAEALEFFCFDLILHN